MSVWDTFIGKMGKISMESMNYKIRQLQLSDSQKYSRLLFCISDAFLAVATIVYAVLLFHYITSWENTYVSAPCFIFYSIASVIKLISFIVLLVELLRASAGFSFGLLLFISSAAQLASIAVYIISLFCLMFGGTRSLMSVFFFLFLEMEYSICFVCGIAYMLRKCRLEIVLFFAGTSAAGYVAYCVLQMTIGENVLGETFGFYDMLNIASAFYTVVLFLLYLCSAKNK